RSRLLARQPTLDANLRGDDPRLRAGGCGYARGENLCRPRSTERAKRSRLEWTATEFALSFFSIRAHRRINGFFCDPRFRALANRRAALVRAHTDRVFANVCCGPLFVGRRLGGNNRSSRSLRSGRMETTPDPEARLSLASRDNFVAARGWVLWVVRRKRRGIRPGACVPGIFLCAVLSRAWPTNRLKFGYPGKSLLVAAAMAQFSRARSRRG